ncbi:type II secretion system F family protein [Helicobacter aurati]|uniref:Type II secretion system F family protein n=1 Tax=Helicobacter aurati TaxID=137778 RepID=A0A3D8J4U5_9HELI|nr:type II secretion system F family protein [Helicobacter aurati]RDU72532.1 type II secretion system F family protein [Helicobacter aurati]
MNLINKIDELENVFWQLGFGYGSGIGLLQLLESIKGNLKYKENIALLESMQSSLERGLSLTSAVKEHKRLCGDLVVALFQIAEKSGKMQEICQLCAKELRQQNEFYRIIIKAMVYPCFLLLTTLIVFIVVSLFVIPEFAAIYRDLDATLGLSSRIIIYIGETFSFYYSQIVLCLLLIVGALWAFFSRKIVRDKLLFGLPIVNAILRDYELYRYFLGMHYFLKSQVPFEESLQICTGLVGNIILKHELFFVLDSIRRGIPFSESLRELQIEIANIGLLINAEQSGTLDKALALNAEFYKRRYNNTLQYISILVEPIAVMCVGALVAWIAFAVVSPIWELLVIVN